jgi:competence protein ComEC
MAAAVVWRLRSGLLPGAVILVAAVLSGGWAASRQAAVLDMEVPGGDAVFVGRVVEDPGPGVFGTSLVVKPSHLLIEGEWTPWRGPHFLVSAGGVEVAAGERVLVAGMVRPNTGMRRSGPVAAMVAGAEVTPLGEAEDPLFAVGNVLRRRVLGGVAAYGGRPASALLTGFLIGDVRELPTRDEEALRRSGLSHYVAVSGSNVALFLAAWWLASGPLGWEPRRRAVLGLLGLAVFLVVTRWEPSVLRAATMASFVLGGRLAGVPVDGWTALGGAVTGLALVSGGIIADVGFQLSVAATAGVLAGAGLWRHRRPRWAWMALGATVSAQAVVAPLLLLHFGSVPLFAPLTNVLAAPLVAASTALGGIGVITGLKPLTGLGLLAADGVLAVARFGRDLPQLGWGGVACVGGFVVAALRPRLRSGTALAAMAWLLFLVLPPGPPRGPEVAFLDVGQGDAALLRGPSGEVVLVDGGPDAGVLAEALARRAVSRVDLLVITHRHADHCCGLVGLPQVVAVSRVWYADEIEEASCVEIVLGELEGSGAVVEQPAPGWEVQLGVFDVRVLGPLRRYGSANDGSIVLLVSAAGRTVLLPGDIEAIAQSELGPLPCDVLKVPHQGAATSDLDWLVASGPDVAVVSVGPNDYGHPSSEVVEALRRTGAEVRRTDECGDIVIRLDRL